MLTFEDRERAFEAKYAHDEEFRFRVNARRDKVFARWASDLVSASAADADILRRNVIAESDAAGHDDRLVTVVDQFITARGGGHLSRQELTAQLRRAAIQARMELLESNALEPR